MEKMTIEWTVGEHSLRIPVDSNHFGRNAKNAYKRGN